MSALRCSTCGINFPDKPFLYRECRACGDPTDRLSNDEPDADWMKRVSSVASDLANGGTYEYTDARFYSQRSDAKIIDWRDSVLRRLGFTSLDRAVISNRRDVDLHQVARLIGAGATHAQARDIVL